MTLEKIDFSALKEGLYEELFYGSIAGVTICLIGHPFDTLKTRMQVQKNGLMETFKTLIRKEGFFSLYKGLTSPLYTVPLLNAVVFGAYSISKEILTVNN